MSAPQDPLQTQEHQQSGLVPPTLKSSSSSASNGTATSPTLTSPSISGDPLTCQWASCRERCTSPETLYDHVCERHVGRKSTNNLSLQCQWGTCRTTTVKRDHITSHIRVHVPLKPHKCDFCGKSFKRPQDLKKHVKTHADESVILHSPEPPISTHKNPIITSSYQHVSSKPSGGYYQGHDHMSAPSYGYAPQATSHHYGQAMNAPSYGPVYYNLGQTHTNYASGPSLESRKRGYDDLNEFFGNVKRRGIDASEYQDLGARFSNIISAPVPASSFQAGYAAGLRAANGTTMVAESMGGATAFQTQSHAMPSLSNSYLPFGELKTKGDLLTIDHFLQELQHTVYDDPDQTVAAGIQPISQLQHAGLSSNTRNTFSSPHYAHQQPLSSTSTGTTPEIYPGASFGLSAGSLSAFDDTASTPALTPSSYAAASHSPASSQTNISPLPRPAHAATSSSLYPTLPSFSSLTDVQGHPSYGNAAPLSSLGSTYDDVDARRRYSGGFLQRVAPPPARSTLSTVLTNSSTDSTGSASGADSTSPVDASPSSRRSSIDITKTFRAVGLSSPKSRTLSPPVDSNLKLPGVAELTRGALPEHPHPEAVKKEAWIKNVRVIEELIKYVRGRLDRGEYAEGDESGMSAGADAGDAEHQRQDEHMKDVAKRSEGLYPVLRAVEAS